MVSQGTDVSPVYHRFRKPLGHFTAELYRRHLHGLLVRGMSPCSGHGTIEVVFVTLDLQGDSASRGAVRLTLAEAVVIEALMTGEGSLDKDGSRVFCPGVVDVASK